MQGSARSEQEFFDASVLCGHLVPKDSVYSLLAEHHLRLFPDEMFADLFASATGRPSVPAHVVATTMVLQAYEGLSDREACRQLQTSIAWKAATGISLTDEAFHPTVLTLWRNKLRGSKDPERIFEAVRKVVRSSGVLKRRDRRVLDSTVLDDAVQRQDTIAMIRSQIRRVLRLIPELGCIYVHEENLEGSRPPCDWDEPGDVERLVSELVWDANELVFAAEDLALELTEEQQEALGLLGLVANQDVEPGDRPGTWRIRQGTAPDRVVSTVDPESRHSHKTEHSYRDGYKAHVAAEPESGLITEVSLTAGNVSDAAAAKDLLRREKHGTEVLADAAYGSGELRQHLEDKGMTGFIKPLPLRPPVEGGFSIDDFEIDKEKGEVTCPNGITVKINHKRRAVFGKSCTRCPLRARCTKSAGGRTINLHEHHDLLQRARQLAMTDDFDETYRRYRPMAERTIAWIVRGNNRRLRYIGRERNALWLATRAATVNLRRLVSLGLHHDGKRWRVAPA